MLESLHNSPFLWRHRGCLWNCLSPPAHQLTRPGKPLPQPSRPGDPELVSGALPALQGLQLSLSPGILHTGRVTPADLPEGQGSSPLWGLQCRWKGRLKGGDMGGCRGGPGMGEGAFSFNVKLKRLPVSSCLCSSGWVAWLWDPTPGNLDVLEMS